VSRAPPPVPSLDSMVDACAHNRDVAEFQIRRIEQQLDREEPGSRRDNLLTDLSRFKADYAHWADYVGYYRARAAREGQGIVPFVTRPLAAVPAAPEQDRRLPPEREPGGDDGEAELPF
jgi:hypothetical protein